MRLGRAQYFRRVFARGEDQTLILAPQRTGKSGIIADRLLVPPGPAIVTTTRADLYHLTAGARSQRGPVYVFNPQHVGGLPSGFAWNLLDPVRGPGHGPPDGVVADRRHDRRRLQPGQPGMVHLSGRYGAHGRCSTPRRSAATRSPTCTPGASCQGHEAALRVLAARPGNELLVAALRRVLPNNRTAASIRESMSLSLAWATIPQMAAAATPRPGDGFDLAEFIAANGTLYLIAAGDEDSPVAPLFAAFTSGALTRPA